MNKPGFMMVVAALMLVTTGCTGFYNAIEKDTVMVKKINNEHKGSETSYEGVLSQDAVKTLSVNAVNKYFDVGLTVDEFQFELMAVDQKKFKDLLVKMAYAMNSRAESELKSDTESDLKVDAEAELNKIPGGLFYMTLTRVSNPDEVYDLVLNARDGDVLKISKVIMKEARSEKNKAVVLDEIIETANRFIQDKGSYALSDLVLEDKTIRWGVIAELYYKRKDNQTLGYSIMVDYRMEQVVGFNKDLMAMLNYYSGS